MGGGYSDEDAPWRFSGRALYQLNLVKSSEARKHVPADLKLVELFGYTLGGIYLARYEDSPAGTFDEMVALGGLVWNAPTSCAWAARVFVNNKDARSHGVKTCGLPSHFAHFDEEQEKGASAGADPTTMATTSTTHGWWKNTRRPKGKFFGLFDKKNNTRQNKKTKKNKQKGGGAESLQLRDEKGDEVCTLALPPAAPSLPGPRIKMALPSFSGRTDTCPDLLKYSLDLRANVRLSDAIQVQTEGEEVGEKEIEGEKKKKKKTGVLGVFLDDLWEPTGVRRFPPQMAMAAVTLSSSSASPAADTSAAADVSSSSSPTPTTTRRRREPMKDEALAAIIGGKPLLCIAFDRMEMDVGSPSIV